MGVSPAAEFIEIGATGLRMEDVVAVARRDAPAGPALRPAYTTAGAPLPEERHVGLPGYPGGSDVVGNRAGAQLQGRVNTYQAGVDAIVERDADPGSPDTARQDLVRLGVNAIVVAPRESGSMRPVPRTYVQLYLPECSTRSPSGW